MQGGFFRVLNQAFQGEIGRGNVQFLDDIDGTLKYGFIFTAEKFPHGGPQGICIDWLLQIAF